MHVHRTGDVILRPVQPWTPAVYALLRHLEAVGFAGAPRVVGEGLDGEGRETLALVPGDVDAKRVWSDERIHALGALPRDLHRATATFRPLLHAV